LLSPQGLKDFGNLVMEVAVWTEERATRPTSVSPKNRLTESDFWPSAGPVEWEEGLEPKRPEGAVVV
jgi:hypothetical protein